MEILHPPLCSLSLIARHSEICPSIVFGKLEYAHHVETSREHALILGRYDLISGSFYRPGKYVSNEFDVSRFRPSVSVKNH
eukprot:6203685-Pleurochrysis_carterae.AAC.6